LKADASGFVVLAALMLVISCFPIVRQNMEGLEWLLVCVLGLPCAEFVWRHEKAPKTPGKWLMLALISLVGAPSFYVFSRLAAEVFFRIEPATSRVFDSILTVMISPGLTSISLAGAVRARCIAP
jgi:hypothetical protein